MSAEIQPMRRQNNRPGRGPRFWGTGPAEFRLHRKVPQHPARQLRGIRLAAARPPDIGRGESLPVVGRGKSTVGRYKRVSTEEERSMSKNTTQIKAAVVGERGGTPSSLTRQLLAP